MGPFTLGCGACWCMLSLSTLGWCTLCCSSGGDVGGFSCGMREIGWCGISAVYFNDMASCFQASIWSVPNALLLDVDSSVLCKDSLVKIAASCALMFGRLP